VNVSPLRILVIDDHLPMGQALDKVLSRDGHRVTVAVSGLAGLEHLDRAHQESDPFGIVITDFQMDGLDGLAVAESVKCRSPNTAVVLMTAHLVTHGDHNLTNVDCVISKPPTLADLRSMLASLSDYSDDQPVRRSGSP
jgi:CheY-like chemotaxis protein